MARSPPPASRPLALSAHLPALEARGPTSVNRSSDSTRDFHSGIAASAGPTAWRRACATRSGHRGTLQVGEVDPLQASGVGRRQQHRRRHPRPMGLRPPARAQTPAITRAQPREAELPTRRHQVIADLRAEPQELLGHHRTDRVHPGVIDIGVAAAVATEPRHRVGAAGLQLATQHISCHVPMVTSRLRAGAARCAPARPSPTSLPSTPPGTTDPSPTVNDAARHLCTMSRDIT